MPQTDWPYPGSRWWKFDFHTHTPASKDTKHWQAAFGTPDEITPEKWLLRLAFGEEPLVLDQPEDDLDNHLIYDLIVRQIRENKLRRQLIVVTHNPNVVVNGDAELVHVMDFKNGQCVVAQSGALQDKPVREELCRVMEGGREAFARRWKRLGKSEVLSGKRPEYRMNDDSELVLTIYAAPTEQET